MPTRENQMSTPVSPGSTEPETDTKAPRGRWSRLRAELVGAAISASLALTAAAALLRLWTAHLNVPIYPAGDTMISVMVVKNMQTTGWYQGTPELGAPFGQDLTGYPFAVGDTWHLMALKVLSLFLSPAASVNVFYVLGFGSIAAVAYGCFRFLSVSRPFACSLGAVYALLPYHFLRNEAHLFLGAYYAVPVACVLAVGLYNRRVSFRLNPRKNSVIAWATLAGAVLLAGTGLYYAAFAMVLIAAAGILASLGARTWRPLFSAGVLVSVIAVCLAAAAIPNILHSGAAGSVSAVEGRSYGATEFYGLKITNLLLPLGIHRIAILAHLRARTMDSPIPGEGSETLGILGVIGFIAVVLAVLLPALKRNSALVQRLRPLGALTVVALVCSTVAGLNSILAVVGFGELRAWDRISVVIAFLALAGFGHLLDAARKRWAGRGPIMLQRLIAATVAGLVLLVGLYDQTAPQMTPDYASAALSWNADAAYFAQVERELGVGANVFELPYARFPENPPIVNMTDYSHLRGYLHSNLRWSYGGVKNERSEWQPVALQNGIAAALPELVAAGFSAVYINSLGYVDAGAAVEAEIVSVTGPQVPLVSPDGLLKVYDLRPYAARLAADPTALPSRAAVLYPASVSYGLGTYGEEALALDHWHWATGSAELTLVNPSPDAKKVVLRGSIRVADANATVVIRIGNVETRLRPVDGAAQLEIPVTIESGATPVLITTDSGRTPSAPTDTRDLRQQLMNFTLDAL